MNDDIQPNTEIKVPEQLKSILIEYSKNAIRSQPSDLILWSAKYFQTLAESANSKKQTCDVKDEIRTD